MANRRILQKNFLELPEWATKNGLHAGGVFLIILGLYGGQYAALFPSNLKDLAGSLCILISIIGLGFVVFKLLRHK
jgi:hypothetical protein